MNEINLSILMLLFLIFVTIIGGNVLFLYYLKKCFLQIENSVFSNIPFNLHFKNNLHD